MDKYKTPYLILFRSISDALEQLEAQNYGTLIAAQQAAEEAFIQE